MLNGDGTPPVSPCLGIGSVVKYSYLVVLLDLYQSVLLPSSRACVTLLERTTCPPEPPGGAGARPLRCAAGRRRASRADMAAATGLASCARGSFMTERLSSEAVRRSSSCVVSITNAASPPVYDFRVNIRQNHTVKVF